MSDNGVYLLLGIALGFTLCIVWLGLNKLANKLLDDLAWIARRVLRIWVRWLNRHHRRKHGTA